LFTKIVIKIYQGLFFSKNYYLFNVGLLNQDCSLEPKHILFYYRADCLAL